jgi:ATP-binding cassette subfamily D (ALD) protein 4
MILIFLFSTGYLGPVSIFVFFIVVTIINKFLMSAVIRFYVRQERYEGDFRWVQKFKILN